MLTECVKEALQIILAELLLYEHSEGSDIRGLGLLNSREGSRSIDGGVDVQCHDTLFREGSSHTGGKLRVMTANLPGWITSKVVANSIPPAFQGILCIGYRGGSIAKPWCQCAAHDAQCSALSAAREALLHGRTSVLGARRDEGERPASL
jgi:hypothetical protein